jgi:hypothetical protein
MEDGRCLTRDQIVTAPEVDFASHFDTQTTPVNAGD